MLVRSFDRGARWVLTGVQTNVEIGEGARIANVLGTGNVVASSGAGFNIGSASSQ
jgi:hypothetical protein